MRTVDISNATKSLANYARELNGESVVVTKNSKPFAALVPLKGKAISSLRHRADPAFRKMIEEAREDFRRNGGISSAELRRQLGLPPGKNVPKPRPSRSMAAKK
jgi:antitoxin (DNA-binding transcriptional repressor) of toxin-antitoxin stability system